MPASIPIPHAEHKQWKKKILCKVLFDYTRKMGAGIYDQREFLP